MLQTPPWLVRVAARAETMVRRCFVRFLWRPNRCCRRWRCSSYFGESFRQCRWNFQFRVTFVLHGRRRWGRKRRLSYAYWTINALGGAAGTTGSITGATLAIPSGAGAPGVTAIGAGCTNGDAIGGSGGASAPGQSGGASVTTNAIGTTRRQWLASAMAPAAAGPARSAAARWLLWLASPAPSSSWSMHNVQPDC